MEAKTAARVGIDANAGGAVRGDVEQFLRKALVDVAFAESLSTIGGNVSTEQIDALAAHLIGQVVQIAETGGLRVNPLKVVESEVVEPANVIELDHYEAAEVKEETIAPVVEAVAEPEVQKIEVPAVEFDPEELSNRRNRRTKILEVTNLPEINQWVDHVHPYGTPAKVAIKSDREIVAREKAQNLSDDQRELFNYLLANIGKPLRKDDLFNLGFLSHENSSGAKIKALTSCFNRLNNIIVDDDHNGLLEGDMLTGVMLNPSIHLMDNREDLKKN